MVIDNSNASPEFTPKARFTTAVCGLHAVGTAYRMESAPLPRHVLQTSNYPTDEDVRFDLLAGLMDD